MDLSSELIFEFEKSKEEFIRFIGSSSFQEYIKNSHADIFTKDEFERTIIDGKAINRSIVVRNGPIDSFSPVSIINGDLGLSDCNIKSLSTLKIINGSLWCSFHNCIPVLKTVGSVRLIAGDASFRYMPLEDIGELEYVFGNLSLRDTKIISLNNLKYVKGNLSLPVGLKGKVDLSKVRVDGQIRYWKNASRMPYDNAVSSSNLVESDIPIPYWPMEYIFPDHDITKESESIQSFYRYFKEMFDKGFLVDTKGNSNYYFKLYYDLIKNKSNHSSVINDLTFLSNGFPKLKPYFEEYLIDYYRSIRLYEEAWSIIKQRGVISLKTVNEYSKLIGQQLLDGNIACDIAGVSCLTSFGYEHIESIKMIFPSVLHEFENSFRCVFFNIFYDDDKAYRELGGVYNPDYYLQFYSSEEEYHYYNSIDNDPYHLGYSNYKLVVDHAVLSQLRLLLIESENRYRESIGVPRIGEGWISETSLFYIVKETYSQYDVVQHGHPKWLGKQHLDIYFPKLNIGIEYQGLQHYEPVPFFGGEKAFIINKERDQRKKYLCEHNHCVLIYVNEGYSFIDVKQEIDDAISRQLSVF